VWVEEERLRGPSGVMKRLPGAGAVEVEAAGSEVVADGASEGEPRAMPKRRSSPSLPPVSRTTSSSSAEAPWGMMAEVQHSARWTTAVSRQCWVGRCQSFRRPSFEVEMRCEASDAPLEDVRRASEVIWSR
jgi:hypothetical protein